MRNYVILTVLPLFSTCGLNYMYVINNANTLTFKKAHFDCNCTCV
jgi:hypothetical protein